MKLTKRNFLEITAVRFVFDRYKLFLQITLPTKPCNIPAKAISRYVMSWIPSKVSLPPCLFITDSTSSRTLFCTSGLIARQYNEKLRAADDVSNPSPKNVIACAATSSSVKTVEDRKSSRSALLLHYSCYHVSRDRRKKIMREHGENYTLR